MIVRLYIRSLAVEHDGLPSHAVTLSEKQAYSVLESFFGRRIAATWRLIQMKQSFAVFLCTELLSSDDAMRHLFLHC